MKRAVSLRIEDALDGMRMAEEFVEGMTLKAFTSDIKTVFAVERCFTILGEALRHVPDAVRNDHPEVPWRDILGMRNRITPRLPPYGPGADLADHPPRLSDNTSAPRERTRSTRPRSCRRFVREARRRQITRYEARRYATLSSCSNPFEP